MSEQPATPFGSVPGDPLAEVRKRREALLADAQAREAPDEPETPPTD